MRISSFLMYSNATRNVNKNRQQYLEAQEVLITNRRLNRPSDDPIGAARALELHKRLGGFGQYLRNIDQSRTFLDQTEIALTSVSEALQRIKELAVDINSATSGPAEYQAAAKEVANLFDEILRAANTKVGNRYIFAGYETMSPPFDDLGNYSGGIGDAIEVEINDNAFIQINFTGDEVFKSPIDIFQVVSDVQTAIQSGDQTAISAQLRDISDALDQVLSTLAATGARSNQLDIAETNNFELIEAYTAILSNIEDADIVAATTEFTKCEQIFQATLEVSSRILNQSFLDFFR